MDHAERAAYDLREAERNLRMNELRLIESMDDRRSLPLMVEDAIEAIWSIAHDPNVKPKLRLQAAMLLLERADRERT